MQSFPNFTQPNIATHGTPVRIGDQTGTYEGEAYVIERGTTNVEEVAAFVRVNGKPQAVNVTDVTPLIPVSGGAVKLQAVR